MGCNCNKNKKTTPVQETSPAPVQQATPSFRQEEIKKPETLVESVKQKMTMMQTFASAIASRGFNNEKVTIPMKQLRVASCFGNQQQGGVLPPCEHLKQSTTPGKFFCGGCGCGDRKGTWLVADGDEYSKLDYPRLNCPLQMPGFSNYEKSKPDEANSPITRRYYIEQLPYTEIEKIQVKTFDPPVKPTEQSKQ
jgi:hypothetical protein